MVTRGPNSGSRFVLAPEAACVGDDRPPSRKRRVPRRHHRLAPPRRGAPRRTVPSGRTMSVRSTAPTSTASGSTPPPCRAGTSSRWASSACCSSLRAKAPAPALRPARPDGKGLGATAVVGRSHLSIGEVLSLLQEEFPDVTISKIRFLESQGLVDPERTPRGTGSSTKRTSSGCAGSCASKGMPSCP